MLDLALRDQEYRRKQLAATGTAATARVRLLWCQFHDPVTRASQERTRRAFRREGYVPLMCGPVSRVPVMRRGKPVMTTVKRWYFLTFGRY